MTALKAGCSQDEVIAFDTGPGNMLIDAAQATLPGAGCNMIRTVSLPKPEG